MTKKQYFMLLWAVCAIAPIAKGITMLLDIKAPLEMPPMLLIAVLTLVATICIYGLLLSLGMDFAKKIGMRFLLLDTHTHWYKDFLCPAVVIGTLYAGLFLVVNMFIPVLVPFSAYSVLGYSGVLYNAFEAVFTVIHEDVIAILFVFSGFALLMKKVFKNVSMFVVVPVTIVSIIVLSNVGQYIGSSTDIPFLFNIVQCKIAVDTVLLCTVAWLKGFETAVFCHVISTLILSLIVPIVFIILGA